MKRIIIMIKNKLIIGAAGISAATGLILGSTALVSASTTTKATNPNKIAREVIQSDRLNAQAKVLGMTTDQLIATLKTTSMKDLISQKGLSKDAFKQQVQAEVINELKAQGYSSDQLTNFQNKDHGKKHHKDIQ